METSSTNPQPADNAAKLFKLYQASQKKRAATLGQKKAHKPPPPPPPPPPSVPGFPTGLGLPPGLNWLNNARLGPVPSTAPTPPPAKNPPGRKRAPPLVLPPPPAATLARQAIATAATPAAATPAAVAAAAETQAPAAGTAGIQQHPAPTPSQLAADAGTTGSHLPLQGTRPPTTTEGTPPRPVLGESAQSPQHPASSSAGSASAAHSLPADLSSSAHVAEPGTAGRPHPPSWEHRPTAQPPAPSAPDPAPPAPSASDPAPPAPIRPEPTCVPAPTTQPSVSTTTAPTPAAVEPDDGSPNSDSDSSDLPSSQRDPNFYPAMFHASKPCINIQGRLLKQHFPQQAQMCTELPFQIRLQLQFNNMPPSHKVYTAEVRGYRGTKCKYHLAKTKALRCDLPYWAICTGWRWQGPGRPLLMLIDTQKKDQISTNWLVPVRKKPHKDELAVVARELEEEFQCDVEAPAVVAAVAAVELGFAWQHQPLLLHGHRKHDFFKQSVQAGSAAAQANGVREEQAQAVARPSARGSGRLKRPAGLRSVEAGPSKKPKRTHDSTGPKRSRGRQPIGATIYDITIYRSFLRQHFPQQLRADPFQPFTIQVQRRLDGVLEEAVHSATVTRHSKQMTMRLRDASSLRAGVVGMICKGWEWQGEGRPVVMVISSERPLGLDPVQRYRMRRGVQTKRARLEAAGVDVAAVEAAAARVMGAVDGSRALRAPKVARTAASAGPQRDRAAANEDVAATNDSRAAAKAPRATAAAAGRGRAQGKGRVSRVGSGSEEELHTSDFEESESGSMSEEELWQTEVENDEGSGDSGRGGSKSEWSTDRTRRDEAGRTWEDQEAEEAPEGRHSSRNAHTGYSTGSANLFSSSSDSSSDDSDYPPEAEPWETDAELAPPGSYQRLQQWFQASKRPKPAPGHSPQQRASALLPAPPQRAVPASSSGHPSQGRQDSGPGAARSQAPAGRQTGRGRPAPTTAPTTAATASGQAQQGITTPASEKLRLWLLERRKEKEAQAAAAGGSSSASASRAQTGVPTGRPLPALPPSGSLIGSNWKAQPQATGSAPASRAQAVAATSAAPASAPAARREGVSVVDMVIAAAQASLAAAGPDPEGPYHGQYDSEDGQDEDWHDDEVPGYMQGGEESEEEYDFWD